MFDHPVCLILVSQSPRRMELLHRWGFQFHKIPIKISEKLNKNISLDCGIQEIARQKSQALKASGQLKDFSDYLLLSADTLVVVEGCVLGKPQSQNEAVTFLKKLSGRGHEVKTGICLWDSTNRVVTGLETSRVYFKELSLDKIMSYIETGDSLDKAGGYGIQSEFVKKHFVDHIEGDINNIMGLPRNLLERLLTENHWQLPHCE